MAASRAFYVTQESLMVWTGTAPEQTVVFANTEEGLRGFEAFLARQPDAPSLVLLDVIEEEFADDAIPKLGLRDRAALLQRRIERKFPRTPYRLPVYQGRASRRSDECVVIHSAVSNQELLDPWLRIVLSQRTPLTGIFSVPLMASGLAGRLCSSSHPLLFLTQHQHTKLRQVFLRKGGVQSARLSQSPQLSDPEYPQFVVTEIQRSRRYLERRRLVGNMEQLDVCMIVAPDVADRILECVESSSPMRLHFVDPAVAAKRIGVEVELESDKLEALYLATALRRQPRHSYAVSGERRYWHMHRLRRAVIGGAFAVAATCSILAGLYLSDAWRLKARIADVEAQVTQLSETFRRENERFDPIKADSREMKLAVETGDYILANRLPVPWVMQQIGRVMDDYPDVHIRQLTWRTESAAAAQPAAARNRAERMPVAIPPIAAVGANVAAEIRPFDGDMRRAFARIDALAADLAARTTFGDVVVVEYPLDASPQSSLSGEIVDDVRPETVQFRLRLRYALPAAGHPASGAHDESV